MKEKGHSGSWPGKKVSFWQKTPAEQREQIMKKLFGWVSKEKNSAAAQKTEKALRMESRIIMPLTRKSTVANPVKIVHAHAKPARMPIKTKQRKLKAKAAKAKKKEKKAENKGCKEKEKAVKIETQKAKIKEVEFNITTDFDKILQAVNEKGVVRVDVLRKELNMKGKQFMKCCEILEKNGAIKIEYPAIGFVKLVSNGAKKGKKGAANEEGGENSA